MFLANHVPDIVAIDFFTAPRRVVEAGRSDTVITTFSFGLARVMAAVV
jgi:hypothetical protein